MIGADSGGDGNDEEASRGIRREEEGRHGGGALWTAVTGARQTWRRRWRYRTSEGKAMMMPG